MAEVLNLIAKNATLVVDAITIGALEGGVSFEMTREYYDVKADQWMGVVAKKKISEVMVVKCAMAEISLANLAVAFDYPASAISGGDTFKFGGDDTVNHRVLHISGDGPGGGTREVTLWKCVSVGSAAHSYKKGEKTIIEVEFHVLEDTTQVDPKARFGQIVDTPADIFPPTIELSSPPDGGTVVESTPEVVIWDITEANEMDESSIVYGDGPNATFMIIDTSDPSGGALVAGSIVYNATPLKQVTFTPDANWTDTHEYQAIVTTGLKDAAGNHLAAPKIEQFSAA